MADMRKVHPKKTAEERAVERVHASPQLTPYSELLLACDWNNWDEHVIWVANAPVEEILGWCVEVSRP